MRPYVYLLDIIFHNIRSERIAFVDGTTGEELSYNQLFDKVRRFSSGLLNLGVEQGDVVAVICENNIKQIVALLAVFYISAVPAPVNPIFTEYELSNVLELVRPKHVVLNDDVFVKIAKTTFYCQIKNFIVIPNHQHLHHEYEGTAINYSDLISSFPLSAPIYSNANPKETMALLMLSSGTTGVSKGVMLSHQNLVSMLKRFEGKLPGMDSQNQQVFLVFIPLFHIFGFMLSLLIPLTFSSKIIIFPRFDSKSVFEAVQKYQVTCMSLVPSTMFWMIDKQYLLKKYDLSSLKTIYFGGSFMSKESEKDFKKIYQVENVLQGYGMTELSLAALFNFPKNGTKVGSLGKPLEQTSVIIKCHKTGDVLTANKVGEICVKGEQIMLGYLKNPEATRLMYDDEEWFHTGDTGYFDEDGFFFYVGRIKDLIKYQSFQVVPLELENLILKHPAVLDVVVIGILHNSHGELPKALVIKKEGFDVTEKDIIDLVKNNLAGYKHLRGGVQFVDSFPKNSSGKILKNVLKRQQNEELFKFESKL